MRVILLKTVQGIGEEGDVCEVADGHARNHLFPKHLAVPATAGTLNDLAVQQEAEHKQAERELQNLQRFAEEFDDAEFVLHAKANEEGTLYGALDVEQLVASFASAGHRVDPAWIHLEAPLKEIGEYDIHLDLPHGLEADVKVIVEAEQ